jgi:hypothetical protein
MLFTKARDMTAALIAWNVAAVRLVSHDRPRDSAVTWWAGILGGVVTLPKHLVVTVRDLIIIFRGHHQLTVMPEGTRCPITAISAWLQPH